MRHVFVSILCVRKRADRFADSGAGTSKGHTSWTSKAEIKDFMSVIGFMIYLMHGLVRPHIAIDEDPFYCLQDHDSNHLSPVPSQALPPPHTRRLPSSNFTDQGIVPSEQAIRNKKIRSTPTEPPSLLLIAGYSYGALITTQLPNLSATKDIFSTPLIGSAASEIRLRAQQLAKQQNETFMKLAAGRRSHSDSTVNEQYLNHSRGRSLQADDLLNSRKISAASSVRFGGEETDSNLRRASQDSHGRRSFAFEAPERVRKSVDRVRSLGGRPLSSEPRLKLPRRQTSSPEKHGPGSHRSSSSRDRVDTEPGKLVDAAERMAFINLGDIKAAYLLVSPLQGLVPNLVTMWSFAPQTPSKRKNSRTGDFCDEEGKLVINDTLAIFGDRDVFTSAKKLRSWAAKLSAAAEAGTFMYAEISGAGHFWQEDGVVRKMKGAIEEFVTGL